MGLPRICDSVCEEEAVLPVQQIVYQRERELVEDVFLVTLWVINLLEGVLCDSAVSAPGDRDRAGGTQLYHLVRYLLYAALLADLAHGSQSTEHLHRISGTFSVSQGPSAGAASGTGPARNFNQRSIGRRLLFGILQLERHL